MLYAGYAKNRGFVLKDETVGLKECEMKLSCQEDMLTAASMRWYSSVPWEENVGKCYKGRCSKQGKA